MRAGHAAVRDDAITMLRRQAGGAEAGEILAFAETHPDAANRWCTGGGHLTCSVMVVDPARRLTLLTLHKKLRRWMQLGGHFEDGDVSVCAGAAREAWEESGLRVTLDPVLLSVGVFPGISCPAGFTSTHHDLRFAGWADSSQPLAISTESAQLRWWPLDDLPDPHDGDLVALATQIVDRMAGAGEGDPMGGGSLPAGRSGAR